jgi:hypothetical protein
MISHFISLGASRSITSITHSAFYVLTLSRETIKNADRGSGQGGRKRESHNPAWLMDIKRYFHSHNLIKQFPIPSEVVLSQKFESWNFKAIDYSFFLSLTGSSSPLRT